MENKKIILIGGGIVAISAVLFFYFKSKNEKLQEQKREEAKKREIEAKKIEQENAIKDANTQKEISRKNQLIDDHKNFWYLLGKTTNKGTATIIDYLGCKEDDLNKISSNDLELINKYWYNSILMGSENYMNSLGINEYEKLFELFEKYPSLINENPCGGICKSKEGDFYMADECGLGDTLIKPAKQYPQRPPTVRSQSEKDKNLLDLKKFIESKLNMVKPENQWLPNDFQLSPKS